MNLTQKLAFFCAGLLFLSQSSALAQDNLWEVSRQSLVSILEESHYSPDAFVDAMGNPNLAMTMDSVRPKTYSRYRSLVRTWVHSQLPDIDVRFIRECGKGLLSKRRWEIQSHTFTYRSQTVDGREIEMSGRVTFLANREEGIPHEVKSISLYSHQALMDKSWAPSQSLMFAPLKVMWDSAVIEPDFQNWGINHGIEPDGSGSSIQMGRQLADCTVAALEVMRQHGVTLSPEGYTTNWGSSQGAMPALQFAKWYDTDAPQWFRDALRLRSTFSTEAAVDSPSSTRALFQSAEHLSLKIISLVGYYRAFTPQQMGGYRPEDFVPEWYTEKKYPLEDGRMVSFLDAISLSLSDITQPITYTFTSFDQVYAPDILTEDGMVNPDCPKMEAWLSCIKTHNTLEGWAPRHPVYLAHAPKDDFIPYEKAYELYRDISDEGKNPNVHMLSIPFPSFIPTGGMMSHLVIAFLGQILLSFEENPEDMQRRYKTVK